MQFGLQAGKNRESAQADLGVGDHDAGVDVVVTHVACTGDQRADMRDDRFDVELLLGDVTGDDLSVRVLQCREDCGRLTEVVQRTVTVGEECPCLAIQCANHAKLWEFYKKFVDVVSQQGRILSTEIVEVTLRNFHSLCDLPERVVGQVVLVAVERDPLVAVDLNFRDLGRNDEVSLALVLPLDFLREFFNAQSCFQDSLLISPE